MANRSFRHCTVGSAKTLTLLAIAWRDGIPVIRRGPCGNFHARRRAEAVASTAPAARRADGVCADA